MDCTDSAQSHSQAVPWSACNKRQWLRLSLHIELMCNRNLPLNVMKGTTPQHLMGLPITLIIHLFLVYKLTKVYDITRVTSRLIESLDEILLPPPPPSHECDGPCLLRLRDPPRAFQCDCGGAKLRMAPPPPRDPQVVLELSRILALDTPQQNNPCQSNIGIPSATEMRNEQILHNE